MAAVGHRDPAVRRLALVGRLADHFADLRGRRRVDELARHRRHQLVDARMGRQPLLVELPIVDEAAVPDVEPAVAGEDADRFEQIVERRGPDPQQRVARRGQPQLLGAVLQEQPQAAVGKRLRDDPQMIAAGSIHSSSITSSALVNQPRRSSFHAGKSRASGSRCWSRIRSITRSNSGFSASHSGSSWVIAANGRLKKLSVRSASNCAVPAVIRSASSRCEFDVTDKLGPRVLKVLDVDRESGDGAGRQAAR